MLIIEGWLVPKQIQDQGWSPDASRQDSRFGTFSSIPQPLGREGSWKLNGSPQWFNQPYLGNEVSIKCSRKQGSESFWIAELLEVPAGRHTQGGHGSSTLLHPILHPMHLFICILCNMLYNKPINLSVSLSSMSCSRKLIKPNGKTVGISILSQLVRGSRGLDLGLVSEGLGSLMKLSPQSVGSDTTSR